MPNASGLPILGQTRGLDRNLTVFRRATVGEFAAVQLVEEDSWSASVISMYVW